MTTGLWEATMSEQRGNVSPPSDIDKYAVVLCCTSAGTNGLNGPFATARSMVTALGYGDGVDLAGQMAEQRQTNGSSVPAVPVAIFKLPVTTAGSYGTIDNSAVTGTCLPAANTNAPYGTHRIAARIVTGGTLGVDGIVYETASDEVPTYGNAKRLGTGYTIDVPGTNSGFLLNPPAAQVTALVTYANAIRTAALAHFPYTTSSVHGAADTTSDDGVHAAATDTTTAILVLTTVYDALVLHFARGSTVHTTADVTTSLTAASAAKVVVVASQTAQDAITLALLLEIALETHEANLSYHSAADAVNVVSAAHPTRGTLAAGDTIVVRTLAPQPSAANVDAAFVTLSKSGKMFGIVVCEFNMTQAMIAHLTTGMNVCKATNRLMWCAARTRVRNIESAETETAWSTAMQSGTEGYPVGTTDDSRVVLFSSYARETDARTTNVYLRAGFAQFCADMLRVPINAPPACPADQSATGLSLWDSNDVQVGHDEGPRGDVTGLSNADLGNRFVSTVSAADPVLGNAVFFTVPWTLAAADDDIKTMMMRRVATSMERVAVSAATGEGGALLDYTAPDENVPGDVYRLTAVSRGMLHSVIYNALSERYAGLIQNADDADPETGLVYINPVITVSAAKLVGVTYELKTRFKGVLVSINGTFVVQE